MKKFCELSREHATEIINFKKEKIKLLTNEQQKPYENAKICYICKEKIEDLHAKDKNIIKLGTIVVKQVNIEVLHIAYEI